MDRHGRNEGAGNGEGHTLNLPSIAKKGALPLDHNSRCVQLFFLREHHSRFVSLVFLR